MRGADNYLRRTALVEASRPKQFRNNAYNYVEDEIRCGMHRPRPRARTRMAAENPGLLTLAKTTDENPRTTQVHADIEFLV